MRANNTVLVIDTDIAMTEWLHAILKEKSFLVVTANSHSEGFKALVQYNPDVIILDVVMNGIDGFDVCKKIRCYSDAPLLILSALDSPEVVVRALDQGADDFLSKPVPSGVLIAYLNKLIRRMKNNGGKWHLNESLISG